LLILALPVQGIAAASMALCGPIHGRMHGAQTAEPHHHANHHRHDAAPDAHELPLTTFSCSACAACCLGGAISASLLEPPAAPGVAVAPMPAAFACVAGFIPDTPEHPPRIILA
jgi:hypothetical protein